VSPRNLLLIPLFVVPLTLAATPALVESPPIYSYSIAAHFDRISQMARHPDGRIYVADAYRNRILVYTADGEYLEQFGSAGSGPGEFDIPSGVAFDVDGNVYVAEQYGHRVQKFSSSHHPLAIFGSYGEGPGQLQYPTNLAFSPDGTVLYVTELLGGRVSMFDLDGGYLDSFGGFDHPFGIVTDALGDVFVADQGNDRIVRHTANGEYVSEWGTPGTAWGEFNKPVGLGIDEAQNLYVTDQLNNRVQKFSHDGTPLCAFGSFGNGPGEMYNPWAVLPLADGVVFVGDTYNYRIQVWGAPPRWEPRRRLPSAPFQ
jgi:DNA-binding beta-propeller fold protein YncE